MGKYIRHGIAALVGALLGVLLGASGVTPDPDAVQGAADAIAAALAPMVMLVGYAWTEKFLKRFPGLDLQGYIDRMWLKREAEADKPKVI